MTHQAPDPQPERANGATVPLVPPDEPDDDEGFDIHDDETGGAVPRPNDEHATTSASTPTAEGEPSHVPIQGESERGVVAPPPLFNARDYIKRYGAASAKWHKSLAVGGCVAGTNRRTLRPASGCDNVKGCRR